MIVLLPTLGWAWPAIAPIVGSVAAALGYKEFANPRGALRGRLTKQLEEMRRETVALDQVLADVLAEEIGLEERLTFQRDDMILVFRKDARGKFFVEVLGPRSKTGLDLKIRGEEFALELVKKFSYNRLMQQLQRYGSVVVEEQVEDNGRVSITARQWRQQAKERVQLRH